MPGIRTSVRNDSFDECPPAVDGENCVDAERALGEYWRNPEATASDLRDGWFRTGDVGHFDDGGYLYVIDRIKDLIIRGGFNVSPAEVERTLLVRPDVAESAVLGRPDERLGEVPVAYVVAAQGASLDPDELRQRARSELGPVKTPVTIEVVEATFFPSPCSARSKSGRSPNAWADEPSPTHLSRTRAVGGVRGKEHPQRGGSAQAPSRTRVSSTRPRPRKRRNEHGKLGDSPSSKWTRSASYVSEVTVAWSLARPVA